jgi:hypothetical protein
VALNPYNYPLKLPVSESKKYDFHNITSYNALTMFSYLMTTKSGTDYS